MIKYVKGNLLKADVDALINTVNCVGVMGKGIALQFKQAFPENFKAYAKACRKESVRPGDMHVFETGQMINPRFIINFPTKDHWRGKSKMVFVEEGLQDLKKVIVENNIRSVAVPPLGCGNGGLQWDLVKLKIEEVLGKMQGVDVYVYPPSNAPLPDQMPVTTQAPNMTRARALFIKLIELYSKPGYRMSLLEIQKLAYFLQVAGEPLRLNYRKHHYGPYAENLNHVLQRIEGHFIRGYGDRSKDAQIYLLSNAVQQAEQFLDSEPSAAERLKQVSQLIDGFETPYGMELLATVHWVMAGENTVEAEKVLDAVRAWNPRKAKLMQPKHVDKARFRLEQLSWDKTNVASTLM